MTRVINIATAFSRTPGARYRTDGPYSGEEFRQKYLEPLFRDGSTERIQIILDGTEGYATSFLEEAFGGLARIFGVPDVQKRIDFVSEADTVLVDEIKGYIEQADEERARR